MSGPARHKVLHRDASEVAFYSTEEFERAMQIRFLSALNFPDVKVREKVERLCKKADKNQEFERKQKWLGTLFAPDIEQGKELDALIQWIDPQMGYGVFALSDLPVNTFVGEYTGIVRKRKWADRQNYYCFDYAIGDKSPFLIDAAPAGNLTRFINHSRNPNLEPVFALCNGAVHVILLTSRPIKKGEQLLYNYGDEYWKKRRDER